MMVFYDQSCPSCVRDRVWFERLAGKRADLFSWVDISSQQGIAMQHRIDPLKALRELHVRTKDGRVYVAIDAYSAMLKQLPAFWLLGVLIQLPIIKPFLTYWYRLLVDKRLSCEGRL